NPLATILAAKMMLDWLKETEKAGTIERAVAKVVKDGKVRTYDMGGRARHWRWPKPSRPRSETVKGGTVKKIILHEVGFRDGLQMEKTVVPTEKKLEWIRSAADSGLDIIQVGSFVHPVKVPQMADTDALFERLASQKPANVVFSALVLNEKGLERGFKCGVDMFCMGVSASETHSLKNTGMDVAKATGEIVNMAKKALAAGKKVQVSVQSAFGCGYEGPVPKERVLAILRRYVDEGLTSISLADTAGHASPDKVEELYEAVLRLDKSVDCACHFHNTYGMGLANCWAALRAGVASFESSIAGLGGCPFTAIAGGNVCTEDLVHMFQRMGIRTDIRLEKLIDTARQISAFFGREMSGVVYKAGPIPNPRSLNSKGEGAA
ncbi:MAG: hydroxymethylglutaryl-CoA lyase, partial [Pseudomonadota bacterium]